LISDREVEPLFPVVEVEISLSVAVRQNPTSLASTPFQVR